MQTTACVLLRAAKLVALAVFVASCNSAPTPDERAKAELDTIARMEAIVFGDSLAPDQLTVAYDLATRMALFADSFPNHPKAGSMLFHSADLCQGLMQGQLSIKRFERFRRSFPNDSLVADALFMEGHVAEAVVRDTAMARKKYTEFLAQYPNHPFAPGAQFSLENMGRTDDELIDALLKKGAVQ